MHLTHDQIAKIAAWEPIHAGFGRDTSQTEKRIREIGDQIRSTGDFGCKLLSDDSLSNYFVSFAFHMDDLSSPSPNSEVDGLLIYFSACGPVGVIGRSKARSDVGSFSYVHLTIGKLLVPAHPNGALEAKTFEAIRMGGYELLSAREVARPLPLGIIPYEYCVVEKPWDRVFHALFVNTD